MARLLTVATGASWRCWRRAIHERESRDTRHGAFRGTEWRSSVFRKALASRAKPWHSSRYCLRGLSEVPFRGGDSGAGVGQYRLGPRNVVFVNGVKRFAIPWGKKALWKWGEAQPLRREGARQRARAADREPPAREGGEASRADRERRGRRQGDRGDREGERPHGRAAAGERHLARHHLQGVPRADQARARAAQGDADHDRLQGEPRGGRPEAPLRRAVREAAGGRRDGARAADPGRVRPRDGPRLPSRPARSRAEAEARIRAGASFEEVAQGGLGGGAAWTAATSAGSTATAWRPGCRRRWHRSSPAASPA